MIYGVLVQHFLLCYAELILYGTKSDIFYKKERKIELNIYDKIIRKMAYPLYYIDIKDMWEFFGKFPYQHGHDFVEYSDFRQLLS